MYGVEVPHVSVTQRNRRERTLAELEADDFTAREHVHVKTFHVGPKNVEANDAQQFLNYPTWTSASGLLEISCQTKSAVNAGLVLVFDKCQNSLELEILKQLDLFCHVDVLFFRLIV